MVDDIYGCSNTMIVAALGKRVRDYRLRSRLTQEELAELAGVSTLTLKKLESGKLTNIGLGNFVAILRGLKQLECVDSILPSLPPPASLIRKYQDKQPQRVRHEK